MKFCTFYSKNVDEYRCDEIYVGQWEVVRHIFMRHGIYIG